MVLFVLAGILVGFLYDKIKKPYYETKAIATSGLSYFEGIITPKNFNNAVKLWIPMVFIIMIYQCFIYNLSNFKFNVRINFISRINGRNYKTTSRFNKTRNEYWK